MSVSWNPWHGCKKISEGCRNCYVYRMDKNFEKDSSLISKTANFNLPIKKKRDGNYKIASNEMVYTCFTADYFIEEADEWRKETWKMIKERHDLFFMIFTKRIDRFMISLPDDWANGYDNVCIGCTVENQDRANYRLPIFKKLPIKHKCIICAPLLGPIEFNNNIDSKIEEIAVGGESGIEARICDYNWILNIRKQCVNKNIPFCFHQTGAKLVKDGKLFRIKRQFQHSQAKKANINFNLSH